MVHAGLPAVGVGAVPGGGRGQLSEGPAAGWLVVVHTVPAWRGHQVGRLGLAAPAEACRASLVESVDIEPGEKHRAGVRSEVRGEITATNLLGENSSSGVLERSLVLD